MTTNETATVTDLDACSTYLFAVGVVGPIGYGPLSSSFKQVTTSVNDRAPPKDVQVGSDGSDMLKMVVKWSPSCHFTQAKAYVVSEEN